MRFCGQSLSEVDLISDYRSFFNISYFQLKTDILDQIKIFEAELPLTICENYIDKSNIF